VSESVAQSAGLIGRMLDDYAFADVDRGKEQIDEAPLDIVLSTSIVSLMQNILCCYFFEPLSMSSKRNACWEMLQDFPERFCAPTIAGAGLI
jgi:hypothetical protein